MPKHNELSGAISVSDLLGALSHFPLSNTFVLVGILLWVLAITGSVAGKITGQLEK